jgi:predicted SAM-dependent methyltransferase
MRNVILGLARLMARIPGLLRVVNYVWIPIGSLNFRMAYRKACQRGNVRLHVGAGLVQLDGWLNTDITLLCPLYLNAMRPLPIRDSTVSYIFSEQVIEYMPRQATLVFLKESLRVLQPGGVIRIATLDIEALAMAYLHDHERARLLNKRNKQRGYQYTSYPIDILNKTFLEDGNACEYDTQTLQQLLSEAGFHDITRCKFGESGHQALSGIEQHNDSSIQDEFNCVIEGTKPPL